MLNTVLVTLAFLIIGNLLHLLIQVQASVKKALNMLETIIEQQSQEVQKIDFEAKRPVFKIKKDKNK